MVVLDTNTLIYFFKGMGAVAENLFSISPQLIGIPAIVLYEIEYGIALSSSPAKRRKQLGELVSLVNILPFGVSEAAHAAKIRAGLEKKGHPIGPYDVLIASTALAVNGTLVTRNTREFKRVPNLQLADWYG